MHTRWIDWMTADVRKALCVTQLLTSSLILTWSNLDWRRISSGRETEKNTMYSEKSAHTLKSQGEITWTDSTKRGPWRVSKINKKNSRKLLFTLRYFLGTSLGSLSLAGQRRKLLIIPLFFSLSFARFPLDCTKNGVEQIYSFQDEQSNETFSEE